ncbi:type VII secretion protein EccE [Williamsia limnetica]|uniref:Type VII secretion protein EccE n=1 Tax=Williamsia limnetica TaxID=882452 RepID=A0A318RH35_WILLI|nr:type VII secretion protein EccE [Williamsia limnetica]
MGVGEFMKNALAPDVKRRSSIVVIELLIAGALVLSYDAGALWWCGVALAVALSLMLIALPGRMSGAERVGLRLGLWRRQVFGSAQSDGSKPDQAPFDIPVPETGPIGARWDGACMVTVVRIDTPAPTLSHLDPGGCTGGPSVPLSTLAECVEQFDIALESIDVISHGIRTHGTGRVAQVYRRTLGPLPATAYRTVLVVLRLDPTRCPDAVARRGGGSEGALRTAIVATRRVANRIAERGLSVTILSAAQITAATTQLAHGADSGDARESWDSVTTDRLRMRTYAVAPEHLPTTLGSVWAVPSLSTTLTLRLRSTGDGMTSLRALVRFNTLGGDEPATDGLIELVGRQRAALAASLPVGAADTLPPVSEQAHTLESLAALRLSAAGCGQLIGADHSGRAVAVDLLGGGPHIVAISGGLHLAQQVLLRAIAVGARVLVHTDQPSEWHQFVSAVGDPGLLTLSGGRVPPGHFSVAVFHGMTPVAVDAPTIITVLPPGVGGTDADIRLQQNHAAPQDIWVGTPNGSTMVTMVATGDEIGFIGHSLPSMARQG